MIRLVNGAVVVFVILLPLCTALSYRTCASTDGRVDDMFIPGCEGEECIMRRGDTKTIHILFSPYRPVSAVTTQVDIKVGWFTLPVSLNEPDACLHNLPCPLTPDTHYEYVFNISIDSYSPTFSGTIRWKLTDEANQDLVCAEFPGGIS